MKQPKGLSDQGYIIQLENQCQADSEALKKMNEECAYMLMEKDRQIVERCSRCTLRLRR